MAEYLNYTDQQLIELLALNDERAFREVFNRYWKPLFRYAHQLLHSKEESEEIVQEVLSSLWRRRYKLQIYQLSHYLKSAVKKKSVDSIRTKCLREKYWNYYKRFIPGNAPVTEETVSFNELNTEIQRAMKQLSEKSQLVFRLNRMEGKSVAEIAAFLKLSERAIEYHLTRSLKVIRFYLRDFLLALLLSLPVVINSCP